MERTTNYAIIGAGNGGHAAAGHIKSQGYHTTLWNRPGEKIEQLKKDPSITLEGKINKKVVLDKVTDNLEEALKDADVISLMVTSDSYDYLAEIMAPFLKDNQMILLNCGGIGGTLIFYQKVRDQGYDPKIIVGETDTCVYGCKMLKIGSSLIKSIKDKMYFTAIPPDLATTFLNNLQEMYPQFEHIADPLDPGFWDITCLHTAGMVLNKDRIKNGEHFLFYIDGVTPKIGEYMEAMDQERVAVANALGLPTESATEWLHSAYGVELADLRTMLHQNEPYQHNAFAPTTFQHRYFLEEVPTKLIPQTEMAKILGIPQPLTTEIIQQACELTNQNLTANGRTLQKLGLTPHDIRNYSKTGIQPYLERNRLQTQP